MSQQILKIVLLLFLFLFCFSGCGYKEGVLIKEPVSYLWFTGNVQQAFVKIDEKEPFEIGRWVAEQKSSEGKLIYYQIPPGKHRVIVEKNGKVVVDRILFVGNETIQEIQIP
jgi:hypothetical protein